MFAHGVDRHSTYGNPECGRPEPTVQHEETSSQMTIAPVSIDQRLQLTTHDNPGMENLTGSCCCLRKGIKVMSIDDLTGQFLSCCVLFRGGQVHYRRGELPLAGPVRTVAFSSDCILSSFVVQPEVPDLRLSSGRSLLAYPSEKIELTRCFGSGSSG